MRAPQFVFVDGPTVGGPDAVLERVDRTRRGGLRILTAHYAPERLGGGTARTTLEIEIDDSRGVVRLRGVLHLDESCPELLLADVTLTEQELPGNAVNGPAGWQSHPVLGDDWFAGVEYPAASAAWEAGLLRLAYRPGRMLTGGTTYSTWSGVLGAAQPGRARAAFHDYMHRRRPLRGLHVNYNAWWTLHYTGSSAQQVIDLASEFGRRYCAVTGEHFDSFTIDMGWSRKDAVWRLDSALYPEGLHPVDETLAAQGSSLGLWWSPNNFYTPLSFDNDLMAEQGYESFVIPWVSDTSQRLLCLAKGTRYQRDAKAALVELGASGRIRQFKFDGYRPTCDEPDHGHPVGELSTEPMVEGLLDVARALRAACPDAWFEATCFGDSSPWWHPELDSVTGGFGDDAPYGVVPAPTFRQSYTSARDWFTMRGARTNAAPFAGQEVLGIVHQTTDPLYDDAVVCALRGHEFLSLYVNPAVASDDELRFLGELIAWVRRHPDLLARTRILEPAHWEHLDVPGIEDLLALREPYGYLHSDGRESLAVLRNPWITAAVVELSAAQCGAEDAAALDVVEVYPHAAGVATAVNAADRLQFVLRPYETRVVRWLPSGMTGTAAPLPVQPVPLRSAPAVANVTANLGDDSWRCAFTAPAQAGASVVVIVEDETAELPEDLNVSVDVSVGGTNPHVVQSFGAWVHCSALFFNVNKWRWLQVELAAADDSEVDVRVVGLPSSARAHVWLLQQADQPPSTRAGHDGFPVRPLPVWTGSTLVAASR